MSVKAKLDNATQGVKNKIQERKLKRAERLSKIFPFNIVKDMLEGIKKGY